MTLSDLSYTEYNRPYTSVFFDARLTSYSCAAGGHCETGAINVRSPRNADYCLRPDGLSIDQ